MLNRSAAPHNLLLFINNIYILGGKLLIHFIKLLPVHSVFVVFCTYKNLHTCNSQASEKRRKWKMKILYCRYISLLEQFSRLQLMNPSHPDMTSASVFSMHGTLVSTYKYNIMRNVFSPGPGLGPFHQTFTPLPLPPPTVSSIIVLHCCTRCCLLAMLDIASNSGI